MYIYTYMLSNTPCEFYSETKIFQNNKQQCSFNCCFKTVFHRMKCFDQPSVFITQSHIPGMLGVFLGLALERTHSVNWVGYKWRQREQLSRMLKKRIIIKKSFISLWYSDFAIKNEWAAHFQATPAYMSTPLDVYLYNEPQKSVIF